jgi:hypothetical protein
MPHVKGYPGSHWMPPLGNYLLRIAPAATRAKQANKQQSTNTSTLLAILMAVAVRQYDTVCIA